MIALNKSLYLSLSTIACKAIAVADTQITMLLRSRKTITYGPEAARDGTFVSKPAMRVLSRPGHYEYASASSKGPP